MTKRAVIDASVIVKWTLWDDPREHDAMPAQALFEAVSTGKVEPLQPPHWLAEVTAVIARLRPATAVETTQLLCAMELPIFDEPDLYFEACRLAIHLDHHVFDTLYHAVARCEPQAVCITADELYYRKARSLGGLVLLRDFQLH